MNAATPIPQVREQVTERLAQTTVVRDAQIRDATEIYHELHICGYDLWEFIEWVHAKFGTDFSEMNVSKYAPGEGVGLFPGSYVSLTVGAVLDAISQGAWREPR